MKITCFKNKCQFSGLDWKEFFLTLTNFQFRRKFGPKKKRVVFSPIQFKEKLRKKEKKRKEGC